MASFIDRDNFERSIYVIAWFMLLKICAENQLVTAHYLLSQAFLGI